MLTCYFSYLEIHSFFENTTVNTEERRKGHCEGKLNPLSLLLGEHSRIHAVDHVKLVYHIRLNKLSHLLVTSIQVITFGWGSQISLE